MDSISTNLLLIHAGYVIMMPPGYLHILRTIFEVDIDSFEEKPWKLPGVDVSDFFNFGLNEDSWREYCKQLVISFSSLLVILR